MVPDQSVAATTVQIVKNQIDKKSLGSAKIGPFLNSQKLKLTLGLSKRLYLLL